MSGRGFGRRTLEAATRFEDAPWSEWLRYAEWRAVQFEFRFGPAIMARCDPKSAAVVGLAKAIARPVPEGSTPLWCAAKWISGCLWNDLRSGVGAGVTDWLNAEWAEVVSYDAPVRDGEPAAYRELLETPSFEPDILMRAALEEALSRLRPRERTIVIGELLLGYTPGEIGAEIGLGPKRTAAIRREGLRKLKVAMGEDDAPLCPRCERCVSELQGTPVRGYCSGCYQSLRKAGAFK